MATREHVIDPVQEAYGRLMGDIEDLKARIRKEQQQIERAQARIADMDKRAQDMADWLRANGATVPTP
jgi:prefoldin subunit 5